MMIDGDGDANVISWTPAHVQTVLPLSLFTHSPNTFSHPFLFFPLFLFPPLVSSGLFPVNCNIFLSSMQYIFLPPCYFCCFFLFLSSHSQCCHVLLPHIFLSFSFVLLALFSQLRSFFGLLFPSFVVLVLLSPPLLPYVLV